MIGRYAFINGVIVSFVKASLPLNDLGVLRGYGVFEFLRTYNGKPFLFKEHLDRFWASAALLGIRVPYSRKEIQKAIYTLIQKNKFPETSIRIVLTGGPTPDGMYIKKPSFFILAENTMPPPASAYKKGVSVITHEYQREFPTAKVVNYMTAVKLRNLKENRAYTEILYVHNDKVLEATTSNFFIIKGSTLITAKDNILIGTTRNFVISLAKAHFAVEEREVGKKEIWEADEAFLTATNKQILPVVSVDNSPVGDGKVGAHTKILMELFEKKVGNY